jgi:nucleoid-associated protein YgaU
MPVVIPAIGPMSPPGEFGNSGGSSGTGAPNHVTKPPASSPVTPAAAIERSPTTSYDVDVYEIKANDTYESISQEYYNDKRYAAALKAVNNNKLLAGGGLIDIPPIYILKQKYQSRPSTGAQSGQPSPPASPPPSWAPSTSTTPAAASGDGKIYKVPPGGISMRAIARNFLGSDQRWNEIYNLNYQLRPDFIPEGTDVRLPADAKLPN